MTRQLIDSDLVSIGEVIENVSWNRQRTTEELMSFIDGLNTRLDYAELGI